MNVIPFIVGLIGLCSAGACLSVVAAEPPPVADFFRHPVLSSPVLSPSGRYLAATRYSDSSRHEVLVVLDLGDKRDAKIVAAYNDADVAEVRWVNEDRLVFTLTDHDSSYFNQFGEGLFSVDRQGSETPRMLIRRNWESGVVVNAPVSLAGAQPRDLALDPHHRFHSIQGDGSPNVLIAKSDFSSSGDLVRTHLLRMNVETGRSAGVSQGAPPNAMFWLADAQGAPRLAYAKADGVTQIHWRASPRDDWALLREMPTYGMASGKGAVLGVVGLSDDNRLFLVAGDDNKDGTTVLATLDARRGDAQPTPLIGTPGFDFKGQLIYGPGKRVVGVHYLTDAKGTHWFDPRLKGIQGKVDAILPNTNNLLDCGSCDDPGRVLVQAYSDHQPDIFLLYHVKTAAVEIVGQSRPWIKPEAMAARSFERIPTRDGLNMPVHVTRPNGQKGLAPLIVLVHGGPFVRGGEWEWDAPSQFLASRGYMVVEPEFRGSDGYGAKWERAGWKQWGLAMQDDIADATQWAIDKHQADPKRICIAGASYGGYATLMGLARYPALYRCGVEWVGVTDIELMYTSSWSDLSSDFKEFGMPLLVGDRVKDAAQLNATSPLKVHTQIKQPLLMAHGRQDRRVPIEHGTALYDALKAHNPRVEWVVYNDEGHGWYREANQIDFWTKVEAFLDKNLK